MSLLTNRSRFFCVDGGVADCGVERKLLSRCHVYSSTSCRCECCCWCWVYVLCDTGLKVDHIASYNIIVVR